MRYRTRESIVEVCNGYRCWKERRWLAEREVKFGPLKFWWPVINAEWRCSMQNADLDIEKDIAMCAPMRVKYFEVLK